MIDLTDFAVALIGIVVTAVTTVLIPYIKKKISIEDCETVKAWVKLGVQAAEMLYTQSGKGQEKKAYVSQFLKDKGFDLDEKTVSVLIESAVLDMKKSIE